MKKIKYFVLAFAAVCLTVGLASCEKEKEVEKIVEKPVEVIKEVEVPVEVPQDNNWSRYQSIVTADVLSQKKHDKAILHRHRRVGQPPFSTNPSLQSSHFETSART